MPEPHPLRMLLTVSLLKLHRRGERIEPELLHWARGNLRRNGYGHAYLQALRRKLKLDADGQDAQ